MKKRSVVPNSEIPRRSTTAMIRAMKATTTTTTSSPEKSGCEAKSDQSQSTSHRAASAAMWPSVHGKRSPISGVSSGQGNLFPRGIGSLHPDSGWDSPISESRRPDDRRGKDEQHFTVTPGTSRRDWVRQTGVKPETLKPQKRSQQDGKIMGIERETCQARSFGRTPQPVAGSHRVFKCPSRGQQGTDQCESTPPWVHLNSSTTDRIILKKECQQSGSRSKDTPGVPSHIRHHSTRVTRSHPSHTQDAGRRSLRHPHTPSPAQESNGNAIALAIAASSTVYSSSFLRPPPDQKCPEHVPRTHEKADKSYLMKPFTHHSRARFNRLTPLLKQTLRKRPSQEKRQTNPPKIKKHRIIKNLHKYHEGDRKRWHYIIPDQERKRYEAVWASNKGRYIHPLDRKGEGEEGEEEEEDRSEDRVSNLVVRELWSRSRLQDAVLRDIYELVDQQKRRTLSKEQFVFGMWLIDQRLRGRKTPNRINHCIKCNVNLGPPPTLAHYHHHHHHHQHGHEHEHSSINSLIFDTTMENKCTKIMKL